MEWGELDIPQGRSRKQSTREQQQQKYNFLNCFVSRLLETLPSRALADGTKGAVSYTEIREPELG